MLSNRKYGLKNETDIITYLDGKRYDELDEKWKKHIKRMFSFVEDDDVVHAKHYEDSRGKPDAVISVRHTNQYVSIKTGRNSSMHQEKFVTFKNFLKSKGVSDRTLRIIYLYHYGETDKINNNGRPFTKEELEEKFSEYFLEASKELDKVEIIESVIRRCIIKGGTQKRYAITYLYYGTLETGYLLSVEDIYRIILNYREHGKCSIHFGSLNYQPQQRDRRDDDYNDVRIKWPLLALLFYRSEEELKDIISGKLRV